MNTNLTARNLRLVKPQEISSADLAVIVRDRLQEAFGDKKSTTKAVMRVANVNERTATNWLQAKNAPDSLNLLRLAREVPALRAEVARLMDMETDYSPDFQRALADLIRAAQQVKL